MRRWAPRALVVLGVLLLVAGGVLRWILAPNLAVLPDDTDTTRTYTGAAAVAVNAAALEPGSTQPLVLRDVPVVLQNGTKVLDSDGGNALISSTKKVEVAGNQLVDVEYEYAVDRSTMGRGSGYDDVVEQTGVTFGWPIRTEKTDYVGWIPETGGTTPLVYSGTAERGGVDTYVFKTRTPTPKLITDPQILASLPQSIPKLEALKVVPKLGLSAERSAAMQPVLLGLPDPIPFSYTFEVEATYYVEPNSGILVDAVKHETRTLSVQSGTTTLPLFPALDMTFQAPDRTLAEAADDARESGDLIALIFVTLPIALAVAGAVLLLIGLLWMATSRRRPAAVVSAPAPAPAYEPVG